MTGEQRYAALREIARMLEASDGPARLFPSIHDRIRGVLPGIACLAALTDGEQSIRPIFRDGAGEACEAFATRALDRLADGGIVEEHDGNFARVAFPLSRDGRLLGCIALARAGRGFDDEDMAFLRAVGGIASAAVDGACLAIVARRRGDEIERLDAAARDLGGSLEMDEVVQRVADHARALVERPVVLWLVEAERAYAAARAGGALVRIGEERVVPAAEADRIGRSADALREALDIADRDERVAAIEQIAAEFGVASADAPTAGRISIPLTLGPRLVGFLAVGPWTDAPDREKIRLLLRMMPYAASAIENARLHAELRELSLTDPLVQLPNRRQMDLFLEREFSAAVRGRPLSFILFDLDHFKEYNDTFGHREGDNALIRFAHVLRNETRSMNLAARYGGEEFATILSGTALAGGMSHAERIRRRVLQETNGRLSVSAGVSAYAPRMTAPMDLVVAADRALYRAKTEGRNRVCVADD